MDQRSEPTGDAVLKVAPIETVYAGCRFRSRLEARWAVFFDTAKIEWLYEPEGFDLDGLWYLPDFLLPSCGTWIEVKGDEGALNKSLIEAAARLLPQPAPQGGERGPKLLLLGPIPRPLTVPGDYGWQGWSIYDGHTHPEWFGFSNWHKNDRPWWLGNTSTCPPAADGQGPWLAPAVDNYEWNDANEWYAAARSARFEHGA